MAEAMFANEIPRNVGSNSGTYCSAEDGQRFEKGMRPLEKSVYYKIID